MLARRLELFGQFIRFSAIGVLNTGIHLVVVVVLVELAGVHAIVANATAFLCANSFSFWANSHFTFREVPTVNRYLRFVVVSLSGLALAAGCSALAQLMAWHYLVGVALTFGVMPLLSFSANRFWTWR